MARVDPEDLQDPECIFVAASLRVAKRAEEALTLSGLQYAVEVEEIGRTLLFRSVRMGAVFYVASSQAAYCRQHLTAAGFGKGVVADEQE
jgi:hypothetical protein